MRERPASALGRARPVHPHAWLWEPLESDPSFVLRAMFGAKALYLGGKMMLCCCAGEEPWRGLLVCTDRTRHAALQADFPALAPHWAGCCRNHRAVPSGPCGRRYGASRRR